jgi:hypothetical protein
MKKAIFAIAAGLLLTPVSVWAASGDVTAPIHQFVDGFNSGDLKSGYAAFATGVITIVDEFPPHRWVGPNAAHEWAAAYDKNSQANGITDGVVKYTVPLRSVVEGDQAYVIMPMTYTYKDHGKPVVEEGQMTFVLHNQSGGWKIRSWTWAGQTPHPAN